MKELVEVLLLVFIILGSLVAAKIAMQGEMKMRSFLSPDYQLFSMNHKYHALMFGLRMAINQSFSKTFGYCALSSYSSPSSDPEVCMKNNMRSRLMLINESLEKALSNIQQLGYVQYNYWISDYEPIISSSDPILIGVKVHMDMRAPNAEISGDRIIWVNTGKKHANLYPSP